MKFGPFHLDADAGELRKDGALVHLPPQPFKVLVSLARRAGEVVTRQEIRHQIWKDETFVDFDQALNFCIRQIREALDDDAESPRYIQTLPRRGYRFVAPVEMAAPARKPSITRLIVLPFRTLRPDGETDFLSFSLADAITASLSGLESLVVRSSVAASRFGGELPDPKHIAEAADVDAVVTGAIVRAGTQLRVSTQLTAVPAGTLLWSHTAQTGVGDVFQLQDELTRRIVESLEVPLTASDRGLLRRDVPASDRAFEDYLRANHLSQDPKQWAAARDLYLRSVAEDADYAPAWARLGRMHHVIAKYSGVAPAGELERAAAAFRRALAINPGLPMAHKLLAQLEVDLGRAEDAMERLLERAGSADAELFAGLVSACRYCGLLEGSAAADARARQLDRRIRTSVPHTWFLLGEYARVAALTLEEAPYIVAISCGEIGRGAAAITALRALEEKASPRFRDFMTAARTLLEGNHPASVAAIERIAASDFRDPEGLFYLARHLAHLGETARAIALLRRVVSGGFCCCPAIERDQWLGPLRSEASFAVLQRDAAARHHAAIVRFQRANGHVMLGLSSYTGSPSVYGQ